MREPKQGSKYWPLYRFLSQQELPSIILSFHQLEEILAQPLPNSAREGAAFWSNRRHGALQAQAWMAAGYRVEEVQLEEEWVRFIQPMLLYKQKSAVERDRWDGDSIRALRLHLDLSQAELASELGVRQQTISEWETGVYVPRRASSKHLSMVAERAEFPYRTSNFEDKPKGDD